MAEHELIARTVRLITGVCARHVDPSVFTGVNVYFANHTSHLDFLVIWATLPSEQRRRCVPIAARDYWDRTRIRRYFAREVFHALLIDRTRISADEHPIDRMEEVVRSGRSLILFPEGTRSLDGEPGPFKSGLFRLAQRIPEIPLVPVGLENLNRILPKGEFLPVPLVASVTYGHPIGVRQGESSAQFLERARAAVEELRSHDR
jgi:1-acyl-sn-glycerol-3-phosphate acyltransferase